MVFSGTSPLTCPFTTFLSLIIIISQFIDMPYRPMRIQQDIALTVGHDWYMQLQITGKEMVIY
jgi:hypothetical protein